MDADYKILFLLNPRKNRSQKPRDIFQIFFFLAESEHVASRKHSVSYLAPHVFLQIKQSKRKYVEETEDHEQEGIREELLTA